MSNVQEILELVGKHVSQRKKATASPPEPAPSPVRDSDNDGIADTDEPHVGVGLGGLIAATSKLLAVNRGLVEPDDRDNWAYKRIMTPDKLLSERIRRDASQMRRKVIRHAARHGSLNGLHPFAFDDDVQGLIIGNPLSSPLEEINPMHIMEQARRVTLMGPGGVGSSEAVTEDMQAINASQFGFIDPLSGPESERAGIDTRFANGVRIGSDGKLYQRFFDRRRNARVWMSPDQLRGRVVKLPD